jgi:hypothetical protein
MGVVMDDPLEIAGELNRIYDTDLTNNLVAALQPDLRLVDVLLLCVECRQSIKARINTQQWIRVEWIGPSGECQACHSRQKELERPES